MKPDQVDLVDLDLCFCGGEAEIVQDPSWKVWRVECRCCREQTRSYGDRSRALSAWQACDTVKEASE